MRDQAPLPDVKPAPPAAHSGKTSSSMLNGFGAATGERRRVLQQTRNVPAMDQSGQACDQVDPTLLSLIRANAVRVRLHALAYALGNILRQNSLSGRAGNFCARFDRKQGNDFPEQAISKRLPHLLSN
jgi:hypothetical protein